MLAHFMLFSEADIEYRFLMATSTMVEEEALTPLKEKNPLKVTTRFHKISLGLVTARNRKNKNNQ